MTDFSYIKDLVHSDDSLVLEEYIDFDFYEKSLSDKGLLLSLACKDANYKKIKAMLTKYKYDFSTFSENPLVTILNMLNKKTKNQKNRLNEKKENLYKIIVLLLENDADPTINDMLPFKIALEKQNSFRLIDLMLSYCTDTTTVIKKILSSIDDDNNIQTILELSKKVEINKLELFQKFFDLEFVRTCRYLINSKWIVLKEQIIIELINNYKNDSSNISEEKKIIIKFIIEFYKFTHLLCICKARLLDLGFAKQIDECCYLAFNNAIISEKEKDIIYFINKEINIDNFCHLLCICKCIMKKNSGVTQIKKCCYQKFFNVIDESYRDVEYFIDKKINLNEQVECNGKLLTPLWKAINVNKYEIVKLLVKSGAIITPELFNFSLGKHYIEKIPQFLFKKSNFSDEKKNEILTEQFKKYLFISEPKTKLLFKLGVKLETLNLDLNTTIILCNYDVASILVEYENITRLIDYNECICILIKMERNRAIKKFLEKIDNFSNVKYKLNTDEPENNALYQAALSGLASIVRLMLSKRIDTESISETMLNSILDNGNYKLANRINKHKIEPFTSIRLKYIEWKESGFNEKDYSKYLKYREEFLKKLKEFKKLDEECPICFEQKECMIIHDNHFFCEQCIIFCNKSKVKNCPLCRKDVFIY